MGEGLARHRSSWGVPASPRTGRQSRPRGLRDDFALPGTLAPRWFTHLFPVFDRLVPKDAVGHVRPPFVEESPEVGVRLVGFAIAYAQMQSTVPVFAEEAFGLTSEQLGTLYVLNPLAIVLFQLPVVSWIQSWRRTRGLALSSLFWAASFIVIVFAHGAPVLLGVELVGAFLVLPTVGEILHSPLITALASDVGTVEERGSQPPVLEIAKRLGFGVGPVVGGAFFDYGAETLLWPHWSGCVFCSAWAYSRWSGECLRQRTVGVKWRTKGRSEG